MLSQYGLFVLELVTVIALVVIAALIVASARKSGGGHGLSIRHLNAEIERRELKSQRELLPRKAFRKLARERRKRHRNRDSRRRIFVLDFKGDLRASAAASLREEVTAILDVASPPDEVVLRLENSGGTVHEHGFAASQLARFHEAGLKLTVVVDKVAASGGYLMAAVADRIVAAPFAIIGSIGVVAQLPNFHRFLEERGIDFEQITAGRFKRTLSVFGENTDEGREKLKAELREVHDLFKHQITERRPQVDIESVATGEHWYGSRALELELIDAIGTSDDLLRQAATDADLYAVTFHRRRSLAEKLAGPAASVLG